MDHDLSTEIGKVQLEFCRVKEEYIPNLEESLKLLERVVDNNKKFLDWEFIVEHSDILSSDGYLWNAVKKSIQVFHEKMMGEKYIQYCIELVDDYTKFYEFIFPILNSNSDSYMGFSQSLIRHHVKQYSHMFTDIRHVSSGISDLIIKIGKIVASFKQRITKQYFSIVPGYYWIQETEEVIRVSYTKGRKKLKFDLLTKISNNDMQYMQMPDSIYKRLLFKNQVNEDFLISYGMNSGHCAVCGRRIEAEESIERGIGPICFSKLGKLKESANYTKTSKEIEKLQFPLHSEVPTFTSFTIANAETLKALIDGEEFAPPTTDSDAAIKAILKNKRIRTGE